ncbi:MAG TPA: hypothetical protein VMT20_25975 [Terriglobia bacterium]|nr:hypothetical protein [Terriglobia bacterium]
MRVWRASGVSGFVFSFSLLALCLVIPAPRAAFAGRAASGAAGPQTTPDSSGFFPLSQVRVGLKGVGKTILQGDQITEFQVEVLGVLRGVLAPKHDAILVKLSGGGIERTNIVAGMSGSPVYVDGKLMGAVAVSFPFAKEPYGLVTPIEDMLAVTPSSGSGSQAGSTASASADRPNALARPSGTGFNQGTDAPPLGGFVRMAGEAPGDVRFIPGDSPPWLPKAGEDTSAPGEGAGDVPPGAAEMLSSLRLPLRFSGFDGNVIRRYASSFRALGLEPVEGGGLTGFDAGVDDGSQVSGEAKSPASVNATEEAQPGQMVSLEFVRGDFNLSADCTVTLRQGDRLYACGHPVFQTGQTDIPFAPSRVLATVPALTVSFKVDDAGLPIGSIHQDRFGAIYGVVGDQAHTIPVSIRVNSTLQRSEAYRFEVAEAPLLSPLLVQVALASTIGATERALGPSTLSLKGKIRLSSGDAVNVEDVLASGSGAANAAGVAVAMPLNYLLSSNFPDVRVDGIDLDVGVQDQDRTASLNATWASKSEVKPGETIDVMAVVMTPSGETLPQKISVRIPDNVSSKVLQLVVGSGSAINALEGRLTPLTSQPRDVHQMVRALNEMRRNNRLYALLMTPQGSFRMAGDEFPSPPPSLLQTFLADPAAAGRVTLSATSVIADFETAPTPYTIAGQQTLLLKVNRVGE